MNEKALQKILQQLTTEEKLRLTTGVGCWNTAAVSHVRIPSVTMADGPVGLRKEVDGKTVPAVCFPSISKLACSFDTDLLRQVGNAIGEQCRQQSVDVILAPGINIKRNPRCGRNFEYYSEDPYLTGQLASAYIDGVHSQDVGVCVKHFAGNSQEYGRHVCDSVIDDRALHEIYLSAFERVVKNAKPDAMMCAYNKLNGQYCCQNKHLLTRILREDWQYNGLVMSDWGATDDRALGIDAGLDLQMPQGDLQPVRDALEQGTLSLEALDEAAKHVINFAKTVEITRRKLDLDSHHKLCREVSAKCTVLAKNTCNLLPFDKKDRVALIGALAETPYFQGGGSSQVNAYRVDSLKQTFARAKMRFQYAPGYNLDGTISDEMIAEAQRVASNCKNVLLVVGNYGAETEGCDRPDWCLPQNQLQLIEAVTSTNSNVAIVLQCGAPVDIAFSNSAKALLIDYLGGENGAGIFDVVFGDINPCGRLAETWPYVLPNLDDEYSQNYTQSLYKESIYVGYRYYTTAGVEVAFPFGYGLNYNTFKWSDLSVDQTKIVATRKVPVAMNKITLSLNVENCGNSIDSDTVQVYLTNVDGRNFYAKRNLVAFQKVHLKPHEKKQVNLTVNVSDFAEFDVAKQQFVVNGGRYLLTVARHACDKGTSVEVYVDAPNNSVDCSDNLSYYYNIDKNFHPTDEQFSALYGQIPEESETPYTRNSPLGDIAHTRWGKLFAYCWTHKKQNVRDLLALPIVHFAYLRQDVTVEMVDIMVQIVNGKWFANLFKLLFKYLKHKMNKKQQQKTENGEF